MVRRDIEDRISTRAASWHIDAGGAPLVATAIHDGHEMRPEVAALTALDDATRSREEDPYTWMLTRVAPNRVIGARSRFEVDLNRPRADSLCEKPEDCWGLEVWKEPLPSDVAERSRRQHDAFYARLGEVLREIEKRHGGFVVLDLHSYNHRRKGPDAPSGDSQENPDVNVGTGSLDRARWGDLVDRFLFDLRNQALDARENVKFKGRQLARFVHETFPETGCCLAVEFKKTFMDEWTGDVDLDALDGLTRSLQATTGGLIEQLHEVLRRRSLQAG